MSHLFESVTIYILKYPILKDLQSHTIQHTIHRVREFDTSEYILTQKSDYRKLNVFSIIPGGILNKVIL